MKNFLSTNNVDVLLGSETHLSVNINDSEILPENYVAVRKDRIDGYGGVIVIYNKDLLVEEIQHEKGEMVSIKVATYEKPILLTACYRSPSNTKEGNESLYLPSFNLLLIQNFMFIR